LNQATWDHMGLLVYCVGSPVVFAFRIIIRCCRTQAQHLIRNVTSPMASQSEFSQRSRLDIGSRPKRTSVPSSRLSNGSSSKFLLVGCLSTSWTRLKRSVDRGLWRFRSLLNRAKARAFDVFVPLMFLKCCFHLDTCGCI